VDIHPWWNEFGEEAPPDAGLPPRSRVLVDALRAGIAGAQLVQIKRCPKSGITAVRLDIDVERPQDLAYPIARNEPIAVLDVDADIQPSVLALRQDFPPDVPHQNDVPEGTPCALCVDDRPWAEARLTWSAADTVRRIQLWLARAARGELHDTARPLDPIFFRSPVSLVVPRAAIDPEAQGIELVGFIHEDARVIVTRPLNALGGIVPDKGRMLVLALRVSEQPMRRLRQAPATLGRLAEEMAKCGTDLIKELHRQTGQLAALGGDRVRQLQSRIALIVTFPVTNEGGPATDDRRAFLTVQTAGEIGIAVGSLLPNTSGKGAKDGFVKAIGVAPKPDLAGLAIQPAELHIAMDRTLAAATAGKPADARKAVLVGAGSLGSQLALNLAREGCFEWTVVDNDRLLPHNLARHGLLPDAVGMPKATALAANIGELLAAPTTAIVSDVINPIGAEKEAIGKALSGAEVVIDATASVAAARHISDLDTGARRVSAYFNPSGTSVVVLAEPKDRSVTLRDLEAQYHRAVALDERLKGHLSVVQEALRYSGSCRALTNRIPATQAAILSGLAASGIREVLASDDGGLRIWTLSDAGEVTRVQRPASAVTRIQVGEWTLVYDQQFLDDLQSMRDRHLPHETGGVLLGIVDMSRLSIHLVAGLPQPEDSVGSVKGFERGVLGLVAAVNQAAEASLHQIRYVGEWHSHPRRASPMPSNIDLAQLDWLRAELAKEGLPAVMAIAADHGRFAFMLAGTRDVQDGCAR
jgi:hypothetical protein